MRKCETFGLSPQFGQCVEDGPAPDGDACTESDGKAGKCQSGQCTGEDMLRQVFAEGIVLAVVTPTCGAI